MNVLSFKSPCLVIFLFSLMACSSIQEQHSMLFKALIFDKTTDRSIGAAYVGTIEIDYGSDVVKYDGGRVLVELSDCGSDDWDCISDGNIEFAIPNDWRGGNKSWSYRNMDYSVIKELSEPADARKDTTSFILAQPKDAMSGEVSPKIYLYSKERGIIAITTRLQGRGDIVEATYTRVYE